MVVPDETDPHYRPDGGINMVYQILIIVFIAAEPPWHCATNATNCTLEGSFRPGKDNSTIAVIFPETSGSLLTATLP